MDDFLKPKNRRFLESQLHESGVLPWLGLGLRDNKVWFSYFLGVQGGRNQEKENLNLMKAYYVKVPLKKEKETETETEFYR